MHTATSGRTIVDVIHIIDERAFPQTAESWDNVGLLVGGESGCKTSGAVVSIDLTFEAVELAIQKKFNLIVNHHPCIFPKSRGLSRVLAGTPLYLAVQNGISVAAYHTNFDRCALEVIDFVSKGISGLKPQGRLVEKLEIDPLLRDGIFARSTNDGVEESKVRQKAVDSFIVGQGYGFWGSFPSPKPFSDLAKDVKRLFDINGFWITNPAPPQVSKIGFVAGKGASFLETASTLKCDLFITGEVGYHNALSGLNRGMAVMEIGHRESEKFFVETMKIWLVELGLDVAETQTPTQMIWSGGAK